MNNLIKEVENFLKSNTFNNIQILLTKREILSLDESSLKDKIEIKNRGGYCFELNQYFYSKLAESGYDTQRSLGRVVYGGSSNVGRTHQCSIVTIDSEKFLVDVGFGPYTPGVVVPLSGDEVQAFNGSKYRINKVNDRDYQLEVLRGEEFFSLYQFNLEEYNDVDFKIANYYTNTHDDSKFVKSLVLSQLTEQGVRFISDLTFTEMKGSERENIEIDSSKKLFSILEEKFNISLTQLESDTLYSIVSKLIKSEE